MNEIRPGAPPWDCRTNERPSCAPATGQKKAKYQKERRRTMQPRARRLCPETIVFPSLFRACHSRLRSGSVDQQKCNSLRRKSGSFLASGPGLRKLRAPDWPERVAVPGGAHFQGEDVQTTRIQGWARKKKETKRRPVGFSIKKKSTKTALFHVIESKKGSCPKFRAATVPRPRPLRNAALSRKHPFAGDCRIAIPAYIRTSRRAAGGPQGGQYIYKCEKGFL